MGTEAASDNGAQSLVQQHSKATSVQVSTVLGLLATETSQQTSVAPVGSLATQQTGVGPVITMRKKRTKAPGFKESKGCMPHLQVTS